jgi:hypothetical protein
MTAKAIEASGAMFVTSIAIAIISTTTPDHVGYAPRRNRPVVLRRTRRPNATSARKRVRQSMHVAGNTKAGRIA